MPLRHCRTCGHPTPSGHPCHQCGRTPSAQRRRTRPDLGTNRVKTHNRQLVDTWTATYGNLCPGWNRPPHPIDPTSNPLTADHTTPHATDPTGLADAVLCRECNGRKGAQ